MDKMICLNCGTDVPPAFLNSGICLQCLSSADEAETTDGLSANIDAALSQIILTTETAHKLPVTERLDIISSECVIGMNIFRDIATAWRDVVGGRSQTVQNGLREVRAHALQELRQEALSLGADAVDWVSLSYSELSGGGKNMLFVVASGTAVRLAK